MAKTSEITRVYFSHDQDARNDDKIKEFFFEFRRLVKTLDRDDLLSLSAISCYAIFWSILEYMHRNSFREKDIELLADDLRINPKFIELILNNFDLFKLENGCYVSERLMRDIAKVKEKSVQNSEAARTGWLLKTFNKYYEETFGKAPVLSSDEIENLKEYSEKIPDFRKVLPDIIYTLKFIEFDDKIKTKPLCDWLLKSNNLARVYNGEFGKLRHKKTVKEIKEEELKKQEEAKEFFKGVEEEQRKLDSIDSKATAMEYIISSSVSLEFLAPTAKELMKKFDITTQELKEKWNAQTKEMVF